MNHDEHYRKIETQGVEPIVAMESVACLGLPQELTATIKRNLNLALAVKHITRCGEKEGQHANTEIAKAQNYLHRAMTGGWRSVAKAELPEEWAKHARGGETEQPVSVEPDPTVNYRNLTKVQFKDERLKSTYGIGRVIAMHQDRSHVEWAEGDSLWVPQEQLEFVKEK